MNYATHRARGAVDDERLRFALPPDGIWPFERFVSMLLGEIARLTDDTTGCGPAGTGYIAHVDVLDTVRAAAERLAAIRRFESRTAVQG